MPTLFCNCRKYLFGYAAFRNISPHIELEESGIKEDKEQSEEQMYTEVCVSVRVCESEGVWWRGMGGKDRDVTMCTVCRLSSSLPTHKHPQRNLVALLVSSINYLKHSLEV